MQIETIIKYENLTYDMFDLQVNKRINQLNENYIIKDVNVIFDGNKIIAIIKFL